MKKTSVLFILFLLIIALSACVDKPVQPSGLEHDNSISEPVEACAQESDAVAYPEPNPLPLEIEPSMRGLPTIEEKTVATEEYDSYFLDASSQSVLVVKYDGNVATVESPACFLNHFAKNDVFHVDYDQNYPDYDIGYKFYVREVKDNIITGIVKLQEEISCLSGFIYDMKKDELFLTGDSRGGGSCTNGKYLAVPSELKYENGGIRSDVTYSKCSNGFYILYNNDMSVSDTQIDYSFIPTFLIKDSIEYRRMHGITYTDLTNQYIIAYSSKIIENSDSSDTYIDFRIAFVNEDGSYVDSIEISGVDEYYYHFSPFHYYFYPYNNKLIVVNDRKHNMDNIFILDPVNKQFKMLNTDELRALVQESEVLQFLEHEQQSYPSNNTFLYQSITQPPFQIKVSSDDNFLDLVSMNGEQTFAQIPSCYYLAGWTIAEDGGFNAVFQYIYSDYESEYFSTLIQKQLWDERSQLQE